MGTVSVRRCWNCAKLTGEWGPCVHCASGPTGYPSGPASPLPPPDAEPAAYLVHPRPPMEGERPRFFSAQEEDKVRSYEQMGCTVERVGSLADELPLPVFGESLFIRAGEADCPECGWHVSRCECSRPVRVYRVSNPVGSDFYATTWGEVCAFLDQECAPALGEESDGDTGIRITAEHWTVEAFAALGEWEP